METLFNRHKDLELTHERLKAICDSKGYWFPKGSRNFNLFIFGIRSKTKDQTEDLFDDIIGVAYKDLGSERLAIYRATTDPGKLALMNASFMEAIKNGTAILAEGQYRSAYTLGTMGKGSWKHPALLQTGAVKIYRDKNKDAILDMEPASITEGWYGINIHASSLLHEVRTIGGYSAGCQVISRYIDYEAFLMLLYNQIREGLGMTYTYTLFNELDFN